ncbi:MAG: hypothetical protein EON94_14895 [Caulobacteraceae bacterium]|nr:MAG: hypothetical protein EON94_14895 [Caulobacteraceae bacterium]
MPMKAVAMNPVAVKAAPVNPRVAQGDVVQADFSKAQIEPFRVGYYVPPLDSYAVEEPGDDAPLPRPSRRAEDDAPYQRRDWDQRGYGPPPAWNPSWRTAWRDDDDRYDWPQDDGWDVDEDW